MPYRISFLLLALVILVSPQLSASDLPDFLAPADCPAVSSSPELQVAGPADSENRAITPGPFLWPICGNCGACQGMRVASVCGVASTGQNMYCSEVAMPTCSDGRPYCGCRLYVQ